MFAYEFPASTNAECPAMQKALRAIHLGFANPNKSAIWSARTALRNGYTPANRARYCDRARWIADRGLDLDGAIGAVDHAWMIERAHHAKSARTWGRSLRSPLDLSILIECRLVLRWLRRHQPFRLPEILDALTTPVGHPVVMQAAE